LIEGGTIVVANWESLTTTSSTDGSRRNTLTRIGEHRNLFKALKATADAGISLVVVIDESHWGMDAAGTTMLLDEIDAICPALRIEASATPTRSTTPHGRQNKRHCDVFVDIGDVIDAGMLATEIRVNTGLASQLNALPESERAGATGEELVLTASWQRLTELTTRYAEAGSSVRPLMLIQIPDGSAGTTKLGSVEEHFRSIGVTRDNGQFAVWLSADKTPELNAIARFDSPAKVLVFKQAVATGWDCPRAQVLVAFREMRSEIFSVQTVGRILRTPERRHYDDGDLNAAYIYANIDAPVGPTSSNPDRPAAADVTMTRTVPELTLPGSYASRAGTFDDVKPGLLRTCFAVAAETTKLAERLPSSVAAAEALVADRSVTVGDVYDDDDTITAAGESSVVVSIAEHDLQVAFDAFCAAHLGGYRGKARSLPVVRQAIYDWAASQMRAWQSDDDADVILTVQRVIHSPARVVLGETLDLAIAAHRDADTATSARSEAGFTWNLEDTLQVSSSTHEQLPASSGYAYTDDNNTAWRPKPSNPERQVEAALVAGVKDAKVLWWWKNGESDRRHFSVAYTRPPTTNADGAKTPGTAATTYPDYVAELAPVTPGRRRIAVLECKDVGDVDPDTSAKGSALAGWVKMMAAAHPEIDVIAGIVAPLPGGIALNDGTRYSNPTSTSLADPNSGWVPLFSHLI
jgi:type III restriction enzyme